MVIHVKKTLALFVSLFFLFGCLEPQAPAANATPNASNGTPTGEKYCATDEDCACGVHVTTRDCFAGNKRFVDVLQQCPDYCTGIGANLETKCVSGECKIVQRPRPTPPPAEPFCGRSTNADCSSDSDCLAGGCSGQVCQGSSEEPVITTCEYSDCYNAKSYGLSCQCVGGKCSWA